MFKREALIALIVIIFIAGIAKEEIGLNEEFVIITSFIISTSFIVSLVHEDITAVIVNRAQEQRTNLATKFNIDQAVRAAVRTYAKCYVNSEQIVQAKIEGDMDGLEIKCTSVIKEVTKKIKTVIKNIIWQLIDVSMEKLVAKLMVKPSNIKI